MAFRNKNFNAAILEHVTVFPRMVPSISKYIFFSNRNRGEEKFKGEKKSKTLVYMTPKALIRRCVHFETT